MKKIFLFIIFISIFSFIFIFIFSFIFSINSFSKYSYISEFTAFNINLTQVDLEESTLSDESNNSNINSNITSSSKQNSSPRNNTKSNSKYNSGNNPKNNYPNNSHLPSVIEGSEVYIDVNGDFYIETSK